MEKTAKPAPKSPSKVFDISKPGKSMATATSRPVIVSNRPMMLDPMVAGTDSSGSGEQTSPETSARPGSKVVIKPLSDDEISKDTDKEEAVPASPEIDEVDTAQPEAPEEAAGETEPASDEPKPAEEADSTPVESDEGTEGVPSLDGTNLTDSKEAAELEAAAKQIEEIDRLTESKEFFLPIDTVERRRSKITTLLGLLLIVVLGLLLLNLMLDVGVIHLNGVQPVTHFFSS